MIATALKWVRNMRQIGFWTIFIKTDHSAAADYVRLSSKIVSAQAAQGPSTTFLLPKNCLKVRKSADLYFSFQGLLGYEIHNLNGKILYFID